MGDAEIDEEEGQAPAAAGLGSSPLIKWLIYIAAAIFGIIIVVIVSMFVAQKTATSMFNEQKNIALVKAPPPLAISRMDEFRINTSDTGETHFVKLQLSLGYDAGSQALGLELESRKDQLRNLINMVVSQKTKDELKGVSNQLDLREEIKAHINHVLSEGKVKEIYFLEFIVN